MRRKVPDRAIEHGLRNSDVGQSAERSREMAPTEPKESRIFLRSPSAHTHRSLASVNDEDAQGNKWMLLELLYNYCLLVINRHSLMTKRMENIKLRRDSIIGSNNSFLFILPRVESKKRIRWIYSKVLVLFYVLFSKIVVWKVMKLKKMLHICKKKEKNKPNNVRE